MGVFGFDRHKKGMDRQSEKINGRVIPMFAPVKAVA